MRLPHKFTWSSSAVGLCAGVPFVLLADTCRVADNLQIAATRVAEKLESKSSYGELKPNKFKKRTDLKTGRYKTERTRQGIVNIKFSLEELVRFAWLIDAQRNLIGDSDAVTFQSYYLLRVIR